MEIKEVKNKNVWENFLSQCQEKTFLNSWSWGEFNEKMGQKIWRLEVYEESSKFKVQSSKLIVVALIAKITAKRGTFLLIQHLPATNEQALKTLLEELKKIGKEEKADFIRIAPLWPRADENIKIFQELGFKEAPMHANAYEATWKLDISLPEEELLKKTRKTTRYLIRQAQKNTDISIEKSEGENDIKIYQELNREVAKRQNFSPFSHKFIENEFEIFSKSNESLLLFGKYKDEIVAGALIIFWSGIGFYHQGASLSKYAKLSIPYLLQWEAIKEAKKRGCKIYDFWGYVDPQSKHPWAGPTLFKTGFGGEKYEYVKTQDYVLSWKYLFNWIIEKMRKIKRGF